jgi:hypothetical protein
LWIVDRGWQKILHDPQTAELAEKTIPGPYQPTWESLRAHPDPSWYAMPRGENTRVSYTPQDIRFTAKGDTLYAICLGWPGEQVTIKTLGSALMSLKDVRGKVTRVELLGHEGGLVFQHAENGLTIKLSAPKPCEHAFVFKIRGLTDLA